MTSVSTLAIACALAGATPQTSQTVLLSFSAPRCRGCEQMRPTIAQLTEAGYPIRKIDVQRERHLAEQYRVPRVPCFVMLANGQEIDRVEGPVAGQRLVEMIAKAQRLVATPPNQAVSEPPPARTATATESAPAAASDIERSLLRSTVRLRVDDAAGHSYGTGTIIHAQGNEAWILTCGHIFRDSQGKGAIAVDIHGSAPGQSLPGEMISYDLKRDLGLVKISPTFPVTASRLANATHALQSGQRVISIGCNNGGEAILERTRVTGVDRYMGPPNLVASGVPVEGRSGGGLFDESGRLIGVCFAADPESREGVYAAIGSIHAELQRVNLTHLTQGPPASRVAAVRDSAVVPAVATNHQTPARLTPAVETTSNEVAATQLVDRLNEAERSALAEIAQRSQQAEVICIVRPLGQPDAESEVFVLDRVSPEFLAVLQQRRSLASRPLHPASVELPPSKTGTPILDRRHRQAVHQQPSDDRWR